MKNCPSKRLLRYETLEDRALLSVTTGISSAEFYAIQSKWQSLDLDDIDLSQVVVVETAANETEISVTDIKDALSLAQANDGDDLVLVRTYDNANYVNFTSNTDTFTISNDDDQITLVGYGTTYLTINANGSDFESDFTWKSRIFNIENADVQLAGLCQMGGYMDEYGGAIYNCQSTLHIDDCIFSNNSSSGYGGAIYTFKAGSDVSVVNSSFLGNSAKDGGAIYIGQGDISLEENEFMGNTASGKGGAIYCGVTDSNFSLDLTDLTFTSNVAESGGGVYVVGSEVSIENSTFSKNVSTGNGGGIHVLNESLTVLNSTFSDNCSGPYGGGIFLESSNLLLINSTVTGNTALSSETLESIGGGIYAIGTTKNYTVLNTIILGNIAKSKADLYLPNTTAKVFYNIFTDYKTNTSLSELDSTNTKISKSSFKIANIFANIDSETGHAELSIDGTAALKSGGDAESKGTLIGQIEDDVNGDQYYFYKKETNNWFSVSGNKAYTSFDATNKDGFFGLSVKTVDKDDVEVYVLAQNISNGFRASRLYNVAGKEFTIGSWTPALPTMTATAFGMKVDNQTFTVSLNNEAGWNLSETWNIYNIKDTAQTNSLATGTATGNSFDVSPNPTLAAGQYFLTVAVYRNATKLVKTLTADLYVEDQIPELSTSNKSLADGHLVVFDFQLRSNIGEGCSSWFIDWGDNTIDTFTFNSIFLSAAHYYSVNNVYSVNLTILLNSGTTYTYLLSLDATGTPSRASGSVFESECPVPAENEGAERQAIDFGLTSFFQEENTVKRDESLFLFFDDESRKSDF